MKALIFRHPGTAMHGAWLAEEDVQSTGLQNEKRIVARCGQMEWHAALLRYSDGGFYVHMGLPLLKKLQLTVGMEVDIELRVDDSIWQAPVPMEWQEVLWADEEVRQAFEKLTMGRQRAVLFFLDRFKSVEKRQEWAVHIAAQLLEGHTDLQLLTQKNS